MIVFCHGDDKSMSVVDYCTGQIDQAPASLDDSG